MTELTDDERVELEWYRLLEEAEANIEDYLDDIADEDVKDYVRWGAVLEAVASRASKKRGKNTLSDQQVRQLLERARGHFDHRMRRRIEKQVQAERDR